MLGYDMGPRHISTSSNQLLLSKDLPSGKRLQKAIENGYRNSGFTVPIKNGDFP